MSKTITISAPKTALMAAVAGLEGRASDYVGRVAEMLLLGEEQDKIQAEDVAQLRQKDPAAADDLAAEYEAGNADALETIAEYRQAWSDIYRLIRRIGERPEAEDDTGETWDERVADALHWLRRAKASEQRPDGPMTGDELRDARSALGFAWGRGRPLSRSELGRALYLSPKSVNDTVTRWEDGDGPTGPATAAIEAWLDAAANRPVRPRAQIERAMGRPVLGNS